MADSHNISQSNGRQTPSATLPLFQEAHARRTDPQTSKDAAKSVVNLGRTRDNILYILRRFGPLTDEGIASKWQCLASDDIKDILRVSPSGLRSRRAELVKLGFVKDSGRTAQISTGRQATVWQAV